MNTLELLFIDDEITVWGGIALLKNLMDRTGFVVLINEPSQF